MKQNKTKRRDRHSEEQSYQNGRRKMRPRLPWRSAVSQTPHTNDLILYGSVAGVHAHIQTPRERALSSENSGTDVWCVRFEHWTNASVCALSIALLPFQAAIKNAVLFLSYDLKKKSPLSIISSPCPTFPPRYSASQESYLCSYGITSIRLPAFILLSRTWTLLNVSGN